jgi:hypothetical protein
MQAPDFDSFGVNTYRHRLHKRGDVVTLAPRGWIAALFFLVFAGGAGTMVFLRWQAVGHFEASVLMIAGSAVALLASVAALYYIVYREELTFDFARRRYRLLKGFRWNLREHQGDFGEIEAVVIRERRMTGSNMPNRSYRIFNIALEFRGESPTFDIWQAQTREQADHIAETLAEAFGCVVRHDGPR